MSLKSIFSDFKSEMFKSKMLLTYILFTHLLTDSKYLINNKYHIDCSSSLYDIKTTNVEGR